MPREVSGHRFIFSPPSQRLPAEARYIEMVSVSNSCYVMEARYIHQRNQIKHLYKLKWSADPIYVMHSELAQSMNIINLTDSPPFPSINFLNPNFFGWKIPDNNGASILAAFSGKAGVRVTPLYPIAKKV